MALKHAKLQEKTRILLNEVKAIILKNMPVIRRVTDDIAIYKALKAYKENDRN